MDNYRALDSGSEFQENLEAIKKQSVQITQMLQQREQKLSAQESVQMLDRQIARQVDELQGKIRQGKDSLSRQSQSKAISPQEIQRLKNVLDEHQNKIEEFQRRLNNKPIFQLEQPKNKQDFSNKSHIEMMQMAQEVHNAQEDVIDNMLGVTVSLKQNVTAMGQQLDEDKVILRRLEDRVDETTNQIRATDSRLQGLLKHTSDCCLWTTILVEFMIFIFLVIY